MQFHKNSQKDDKYGKSVFCFVLKSSFIQVFLLRKIFFYSPENSQKVYVYWVSLWIPSLEDEVVPGEDLDHVPGREGNVKEVSDLAEKILLLSNLQSLDSSESGIDNATNQKRSGILTNQKGFTCTNKNKTYFILQTYIICISYMHTYTYNSCTYNKFEVLFWLIW